MIEQFLELEVEYIEFIRTYPQVQCLLLTNNKIVALHQLVAVLQPFKQLTLKISELMPSLARSLEMYWDLDDLLETVITAQGKYVKLDLIIQDAFKASKAKHLKYTKLKSKNAILFAVYILDPRYKTSMITTIMLEKSEEILRMVKKYITTKWPSLTEINMPDLQPKASTERPNGVSIIYQKAI